MTLLEHRPTPATPDRRVEVPRTLAEPTPQPLGWRDQAGQWANLGVSLLGFGAALAIVAPFGLPRLSFAAALTATVVGTVAGTLAVAAAAVPGARTGAPAMVLLRGVFGTRLSFLPTALNIAQCLGWATFELVVIADGARTVTHGAGPRWVYVLGAGVLTTVLTMRPLGMIRVLRRYLTVALVVAVAYLAVRLVPQMHTAAAGAGTSWRGFWVAADVAIATAVSWVPMVGDYARHSRSPRAAFWGTFLGFSVTQVACFALGLVTLSLVADDPTRIFAAFVAVPAGALFFAVLVVREVDQTFTTVYSTAVSLQNIRPLGDRRVLAGLVGAVSTALALLLDITRYQSFLYLIGSVFVPPAGVLLVDYYLGRGRVRWDLTTAAAARPVMLAPWFAGFVTYQLVNPGGVGWWATTWLRIAHAVGFTAQPWMSASVLSFTVAAVLTLPLTVRARRSWAAGNGTGAEARPTATR